MKSTVFNVNVCCVKMTVIMSEVLAANNFVTSWSNKETLFAFGSAQKPYE